MAGVNLDDTSRFAKVLHLNVDWAWSYADMTPGKTEQEKREKCDMTTRSRTQRRNCHP
jgi:hypothetical protein